MASKSGGAPIRTNKVRSGPDQAFTLPKGTSAAPIKGKGMGVQKVDITKKYKKEIAKLQKVLDKSARPKQKQTPGTPGTRKTQADKSKAAAKGFIARRQQLAGLKKANKTGVKNALRRGPTNTAVAGFGAATLAALAANKKIKKDLKKKRPSTKYGAGLTQKQKQKLMRKRFPGPAGAPKRKK
tara:strand:- start:122 stop:670 length:549 start_codon:yes stop_codon:yes gene_type:complete